MMRPSLSMAWIFSIAWRLEGGSRLEVVWRGSDAWALAVYASSTVPRQHGAQRDMKELFYRITRR
jgi:hypothetical protein